MQHVMTSPGTRLAVRLARHVHLRTLAHRKRTGLRVARRAPRERARAWPSRSAPTRCVWCLVLCRRRRRRWRESCSWSGRRRRCLGRAGRRRGACPPRRMRVRRRRRGVERPIARSRSCAAVSFGSSASAPSASSAPSTPSAPSASSAPSLRPPRSRRSRRSRRRRRPRSLRRLQERQIAPTRARPRAWRTIRRR